LYDLNIILKPLLDFKGAIEIVLGLLLVFAGAWSLKNTIKLLVFLCISGALMLFFYNTRLFFMGLNEGKIWIIVLLALGSIFTGILITWLVGNLIKDHVVSIFGFVAGALLTWFFVDGTDLHVALKVTICIAIALLCFCLFNQKWI